MKLKHRTAALFLFTLLATCALLVCSSMQEEKLSLSVDLTCAGTTEQLKSWKNKAGEYFIFLPSYADLKQAYLTSNGVNILIDGKPLKEDSSLSEFSLDTAHKLQYGRKKHESTLTIMKAAGVPAMYIDTASGSMEYIHAKNGNKESGYLRLYATDGSMDNMKTITSINGRGNYTWEMSDKKPYSFTLFDDANLLGMGSAQKWILISNAEDPSHMRNKVVYDLANEVGMAYSPQSEWVSLYLNGEYAGLYLLCERNEVHPERVDIEGENAFLLSTGRKDRLEFKNRRFFSTESGQNLRIHFPESISSNDLEALHITWQTIENALISVDGKDPVSGKSYEELIDLDSWVRKYLLEEISCNLDACYISQYYYADGNNERMFAGPVWDYDLSLGNPASWQTTNPNCFLANRPESEYGTQTPWFYSLYKKELFYDRMCELYETDFLPALKKLLADYIPDYSTRIKNAACADYIRWEIDASFADHTSILSAFLRDRISFLSDAWLAEKEFCQVYMVQEFGGFGNYAAVSPGECLSFLPEFADTDGLHFLGWYYTDSHEPVDPNQPVYKDISIYGKWQDTGTFPMDIVFKLTPLCIIAIIFVLIFIADMRMRKHQH